MVSNPCKCVSRGVSGLRHRYGLQDRTRGLTDEDIWNEVDKFTDQEIDVLRVLTSIGGPWTPGLFRHGIHLIKSVCDESLPDGEFVLEVEEEP